MSVNLEFCTVHDGRNQWEGAVDALSCGLRFWRRFFGYFLWTSKESNETPYELSGKSVGLHLRSGTTADPLLRPHQSNGVCPTFRSFVPIGRQSLIVMVL